MSEKISTIDPVVPDGGWGWLVVFASFLIHFIMDGITYSMGQAFLEPMRTNLALDRAPVSTIFGILPAVTLGAGPIATVLTNMYGCRTVAIIGTIVAALGFLASRLWANIFFYYITIGVIGGLGFALMYLPAIVSVGLYFNKKRAFAMGIAVCGSGLGTSAFSHLMDGLINVHKWISYQNGLLLESGIIMITLICGFLMLPLPQEPSERRRLERKLRAEKHQNEGLLVAQNGSSSTNKNPTDVIVVEEPANKSFLNQILEQIDLKLLKSLAFALFVASNFLASLGFNVIYNFADDLANDAKVPKDVRSYILVALGVANILGRLIIGFFGDRKWVNRLVLFNITLIISGVATIIAPLCGSSVYSHIFYSSLFGFFSGGYVALTAIVLADIVGINKLSDAFGVLLLFVGIATAIGTPITGAMRDAFASYSLPFLWPYAILGGFTVLSGIILFAVPFLMRLQSNSKEEEIACDVINPEKIQSFEEQQQKV